MKYILILFTLFLFSCNWTKQKAKETVNKTGEAVGRAGSEFTDGVAKGIERTFENEVSLSNALQQQGIKTGKIIINGTDSTSDNILSVYFIFNKDFDSNITIKVMDDSGQEYGRRSERIKAKQNDAGYFDFVFDKRTNIDGKGKLVIE